MTGSFVEDADTTVIEGDATTGLADQMLVRLSKAPTDTVVVKLGLDLEADQEIKLSSTDSRVFTGADGELRIAFEPGDWDDYVVIDVEARNDARVEDPDGVAISVERDDALTLDADYVFPNLRSGPSLFEVNVLDDDTAGALVQESGGDTQLIRDDLDTPADETVGDSYTVRLTGAPEAGSSVDVAVVTDGLADVVSIDGAPVTPADYDEIGGLRATQKFQGQAVAENLGGQGAFTRDGVAQSFGSFVDEGFEAGDRVRVANLGAGFDGDYTIAAVSDLTITLEEAFAGAGQASAEDAVLSDLADVGIFEGVVRADEDLDPDFGGEQLVRVDGTGWLTDGFLEGQWVRIIDLDNPSNEIEVKIELIRGDNDSKDEKLQITEGAALPGWLTDAADDNVRVVRIAPVVTFTDADYWVEREIGLEADPNFDTPITRAGAKVFPAQSHLLSKLRGPLQVEGGVTGADRSLQNGLKLPGEADDFLIAIGQQPPESQQIDVLNIFNDSSQEDGSGVMTETTLTGFGMAEELDFGPASANDFGEPTVVPGGISWGKITLTGGGFSTDAGKSTIEVVNVMLGEGNDTMDVQGTLNPAPAVQATGAFTATPDAGGSGGTLSREGIDWLALGFLPGQFVEIEGLAGSWTVEAIDDAVTPEGQDPNDNSILVLSGDPLPALAGEVTVTATDPLVEVAGSYAVATAGNLTRVTRSDGGDWAEDGFLEGHLVRVVGDGQDQSVRLVAIEDGGETLVLENATLSDAAALDLELSVQGPHGGLTVLHGGGNRPLSLCVEMLGETVAGNVELTRGDGLSWADDDFAVGDYVQVDGEAETRQILAIENADPALAPADAFEGWGTGAVLVLDGPALPADGTLGTCDIHVSEPRRVTGEVELDLDCCDKGEGTIDLVLETGGWEERGFFTGQEVTIEGLPGFATVTSIDGGTMVVAYDRVGLPIEGTVTVAGFNPRLDGGTRIGGDRFDITGGAGPDSPLVVYGDTSQDGVWYSGQPFSVLGADFGEKPFDPFPLLPDGDNEDDEWVFPLANPYSFAGNDIIDASALFAGLDSADLPSVGITAYGGVGDDLIIGSQAGDHLAGGSGNDTIEGQRGTDHIYGDSGVNVDILTRALDIATVDLSPLPTLDPTVASDGTTLQPAPSPVRDDLTAGDDVIYGDGPGSADGGATAPDEIFRDILFGDHGVVIQTVEDPNLPPAPLQKIQTTDLDTVTEVIGVGPQNGGNDQIFGGQGQDVLMGGAGDDVIDTGPLQNLRDVVFGDNGRVTLNGSETFDGPSGNDGWGEEFTTLSFNFDNRPGQADVNGVAGTNDSISVNGLPAPREENWNNLRTPSGTLGDEAGEFVETDAGLHLPGVFVGWRQKTQNLPIYDDTDRTDGLGYTDADYAGEDIFWDEDDYRDDLRYFGDQRARFDTHNQLFNGDDPDNRLFEGMVWVPRNQTIEIVVEGLADHFEEYDVYIYLDNDNGTSPATGPGTRIVKVGSDDTFYVSDPRRVHFDGTYILSDSQDPNAPAIGNYVALGGQNEDRLVIEISQPRGAEARTIPTIAGFQIVGRSHPIDRAESVDLEVGGNDAIYTGGGDDVVFGGTGNDWIETQGDADVGHLDYDAVFGDNGRATFLLTEPIATPAQDRMGELRNMQALTISEVFSFDDVIMTGNGDDAVIGGQGEDCIETGDTGAHNAVDDALSGADVRSIGINFGSGVSEGFVEGQLGYVSHEGWNNIDTQDLGDYDDPTDGLNDENGFKGTEEETYTLAEGVRVTIGRELGTLEARRTNVADSVDLDPDTQNGRLFNGRAETGNQFLLGVDVSDLDQHYGEGEVYDVYLYIAPDLNWRRFAPDVQLVAADGTVYTVEDYRPAAFDGEFHLYDAADPLAKSNVLVFKDVVGDDFSVRIVGHERDGKPDNRYQPQISALQIVGGADKDAIVPQGDFDSDRVLGDQGEIRIFQREVFEMTSTPRGILEAADKISTGVDGDVVVGGDGADFVYGGDGDDVVAGDNARVRLFDGEVIQINIEDEAKRDPSARLDAPNFDPFAVTGLTLLDPATGFGDTIDLGRGDDWAYGGAGDDNYVFAGERLGENFLVEAGTFTDTTNPDDDGDGVPGVDVPAGLPNDTGDALDFTNFHGPVEVFLFEAELQAFSDRTTLGDKDGSLKLWSGDAFEDIAGSQFADNLRANDRNNAIKGLGGNDTISSGYGHDFVDAGDGNDLVWMGIDASLGDYEFPAVYPSTLWRHVVLGGEGNDRLFLANGIDLADGGPGDDVILGGGYEGEFGTSLQPGDLLFGNDGSDRIEGGRSIFDTLVGEGGPDFLRGGTNDVEVEASLDPADRDARIADMLGLFQSAAARSDFIFVPATGEPLRGKVQPFIDTICAPVPCPPEAPQVTLNLTAAYAPTGPAPAGTDIDQATAETVLEAARETWIATGLLDAEQIEALEDVSVTVADLDGLLLGETAGELIFVDVDGAGHGWFVDVSPAEEAGFVEDGEGVWRAEAGSAAEDRMDLFSVLLHELGHTLGFDHIESVDPAHVMNATLEPGTRFDDPATLVFDERTGTFTDPDTARGLAALTQVSETPAEPEPVAALPRDAGQGRVQWHEAASSLMQRLSGLFGR
ncbi:matrixin family metalloprotease [Rhodosalinus sp. K401]|uniref:matrixin family metalloprotease n=1 Tax=Rhodosalinus sp. K401 TaxID=3239195 RepID=UPI0035239B5B